MMKIRHVLVLLSLTAISATKVFQKSQSYAPITRDDTADSFNFIFFGDWGWNSFNQSLTAYEMGVMAWVIDAQFIVALGDNFYADGVTDTQDSLWEEVYHDIYTAESLQVPWYPILGNHDYHGNVIAQVERSYTQGEHIWKMPSTYYTMNYKVPGGGIMSIVYIDTCLLDPYQRDTSNILEDENFEYRRSAHLAWIDEQLESLSSTATWLIVAGHYPIISIGEHGDDQYLIDDLLPLLLKHNVHAYINGHDHMHQHVYKDGLHHITAGNGAGRGPFGHQASQYNGISAATDYVKNFFIECGFAFAEVTSSEFYFTFVDNFGRIRYRADIGEPHNSNSAVDKLKGLGVSPDTAGTIILVPVLLFAVLSVTVLSYNLWFKKETKGFSHDHVPLPDDSTRSTTEMIGAHKPVKSMNATGSGWFMGSRVPASSEV